MACFIWVHSLISLKLDPWQGWAVPVFCDMIPPSSRQNSGLQSRSCGEPKRNRCPQVAAATSQMDVSQLSSREDVPANESPEIKCTFQEHGGDKSFPLMPRPPEKVFYHTVLCGKEGLHASPAALSRHSLWSRSWGWGSKGCLAAAIH